MAGEGIGRAGGVLNSHRALFSVVVAAALLGAAPPPRNLVPVEFRAGWTNEQRFCGVEGDNLDSVLSVTAEYVGFYENEWRVKSVSRTRQGIRMRYFPRDDFTMYAPNYLRLSPDQQRIYTSDDRKDTGYKRCPKVGE